MMKFKEVFDKIGHAIAWIFLIFYLVINLVTYFTKDVTPNLDRTAIAALIFLVGIKK